APPGRRGRQPRRGAGGADHLPTGLQRQRPHDRGRQGPVRHPGEPDQLRTDPMVTRVSTAGNYAAILANLMAAENRQVDAENRVSSQKNGSNLKDYAKKAETLTAMKSVE